MKLKASRRFFPLRRDLFFDNCIVWEEKRLQRRSARLVSDPLQVRPSVYGRTTDALASRGEEGRDKLR